MRFIEQLYFAVENNDIVTVEAMLLAGLNVHSDRDYCIKEAASNGNNDMVKLLLRFEAHPNRRGQIRDRHEGLTPIVLAARNGHVEVVKTLLEDNRVDIYLSLTASIERGHTEVVKVIMDDTRLLNQVFSYRWLNKVLPTANPSMLKFLSNYPSLWV